MAATIGNARSHLLVLWVPVRMYQASLQVLTSYLTTTQVLIFSMKACIALAYSARTAFCPYVSLSLGVNNFDLPYPSKGAQQ